MSFSCPQCNFTSQFESALIMHEQLHHGAQEKDLFSSNNTKEKPDAMPRISGQPYQDTKEKKGLPLTGRTSSATRLLGKLRSRITRSRSRILFSHPEETPDVANDLTAISECTSKGMHLDGTASNNSALTTTLEPVAAATETYRCHLCSLEADRITVLDRHLLNDHKISLDNLLKLVLVKTKDGVSDENEDTAVYGIRQPYYRPQDEVIEDGEFIIETVSPKIKILKHAATNTDLKWADIPDLKDNCRIITQELDKLIKYPLEMTDKNAFLTKMETLNECMCKFADSSKNLKKVLNKDFDSKISVRPERNEPFFDLGLGDQDTPRNWERAHSDNMVRSMYKRRGNRGGKAKLFSESFYF